MRISSEMRAFLFCICPVFALNTALVTSLAGQEQTPAARSTLDQLPPAPTNPALHTVVIVGDSTASFHPDRLHEGYAAAQGWGVFLFAFFDPQKVNVVNAARGGRSTRTYITEGLWDKVVAQLKPDDVVLIQLGQNDIFPINDGIARGTIPGIGPETQDIVNSITGKPETVHTFGWYLRRYIEDTRARRAIPIVLSLTTRDVWKDGHVEVGVNNYREDSFMVAREEHADFVDASALIAEQYEKLGPEKTFGMFHDKEPVHLDLPGAFMDARCILAGLKGLPDAPVTQYLSYTGEQVEAESTPIPVESQQNQGSAKQ